jgi:hypothetical protein
VWWERRPGLQVPEVLIEVSANIVEKAESVWVIVVRRPVSPAAGGLPPPLYRLRREQFTCVTHYFPMCGGMASSAMELMAVLANPAPAEGSWRVLCSYRSGFEGNDVVVGRPATTAADSRVSSTGGPYAAQWQSWRRRVLVHSNSIGMLSQCSVWRGSVGDSRTGLTATGKTAPAGLTSRRGPM